MKKEENRHQNGYEERGIKTPKLFLWTVVITFTKPQGWAQTALNRNNNNYNNKSDNDDDDNLFLRAISRKHKYGRSLHSLSGKKYSKYGRVCIL